MKAGTVIRSPLRGFRFSISGTGVIRLTTRHPTPAFVQIPRPPPASDRLDAHQIFEFFFRGETFRREADGGARQRRIDSFFVQVKTNNLSSGGRRKITNLNGAEGKYFPAHPARYTHTRVLVTQRRVIAMR